MRTSDALAVMENILGSHCNGSSATAVIAVGPVISTLRRVHGSRDLNYSNCIFHSFGSWARSGALECSRASQGATRASLGAPPRGLPGVRWHCQRTGKLASNVQSTYSQHTVNTQSTYS